MRRDFLNDPDAPAANSIVIAVSVFVLDADGRLLLIRRADNGRYAIPVGKMELGETLTEAAVREVDEETGVAVEIVGLIGLYSDPQHRMAYDDGEVRQEFSVCFRAKYLGGQPRISDESPEVLWVERDGVAALDILPSIRKRIEHGYEGSAVPFYT